MIGRYGWVFLLMIPVGLMLGFIPAAVITYVMPKTYEAQAVIEVKPRRVPVGGSSAVSPGTMATEMEKIRSRRTFEDVVKELELINRWSVDPDTAVRMLKEQVTTKSIKSTDLIEINVRHTNKIDARDIAEQVARSYQAQAAEIENRAAEAQLHELNKAVRDQEDKVEEKRKVLATIVRTKGIVIRGTDVPATDGQNGDASLDGSDMQDYLDAKSDYKMDQELLQTLKLKQVSESISSKLPNRSVEIHEEPVIPQTPVSPNVTLNLLIGTVVGLGFSLPLAWLTAWLLSRRAAKRDPQLAPTA